MSDFFGFDEVFDKSADITIESNEETLVVHEDSKAYPIAQAIVSKQADLDAYDNAHAEKRTLQKSLEAQKAEIQKQMDAITQQLSDIGIELREYNFNRRRMVNEISALKTQLSIAINDELRSKELLDNKLEFDKKVGTYQYGSKIMEHQKDGAFILATNMRCILGDKMGAGKTLTSIAAWDMAQCQRVLVIVPDDVVSNFVSEIHYWAPHRDVFQIGKMDRASRQFALNMAKSLESFVMVCNYSAWRKDKSLIESFIELRLDTVVLDEAHEIKNTSTSAYKGVRDIILAENCCPKCSGPVRKQATKDNWNWYWDCEQCPWDSETNADWNFLDRCSVKMVVPMTGTVILNKPQDLFALLSLVDPINFKYEKDFLNAFCQQNIWNGKWEFKPGGLKRLKSDLAGKYLAREGVKTPGQHIYYHDLTIDPDLYPDQHRVIEQLSKHAQLILESGKKLSILYTISLILRKRQANVWPAGITLKDEEGNIVFNAGEEVNESIKLDKCIAGEEGLIPDLTENGDKELGSRVVVFSQFKGPLIELERRLKAAGISVVRFDGDTPESRRIEAKHDFDRKYCDTDEYRAQYEGGYRWQVILCNYKTGGVGLNFTAATETIILDREWNPGKEAQALGRTDRIGQTEESNVHIIRLANTIDVWMDALIDQKAAMIDGFNDSTAGLSQDLLSAMKNGDIL